MSTHETKTALLFPGQGLPLNSNHVRSFYDNSDAAKQLFDTVNYDFSPKTPSLRELCLDGGSELENIRYSQACIFLASVAIAEAMKQIGIQPDAFAGLSLGEYSALCAADSFDIQSGVNLLAERGKIMADRIPDNTGMAAVLGLGEEEVQAYCEAASKFGVCEIATYSTKKRLVITGNRPALEHAKILCEQRDRVKVTLLGTSRAFHSSLAKEAADAFNTVLGQTNFVFQPPKIPVYYNVDGMPEHTDIAAVEVAQFYTPVNLTKTVEAMCKDGIRRFVAIGPGVSMAAYARETANDLGVSVETHVVETFDDMLALRNKIDEARA